MSPVRALSDEYTCADCGATVLSAEADWVPPPWKEVAVHSNITAKTVEHRDYFCSWQCMMRRMLAWYGMPKDD